MSETRGRNVSVAARNRGWGRFFRERRAFWERIRNVADQNPPGWYPDARSPGQHRYWDGAQWTERVAPLAASPVVVPTKKGHGCLYVVLGGIAVIVIGIVALVAVVGTAAKKLSIDVGTPAMREVTVTSCQPDVPGDTSVQGTARNTTSKRSNFLIVVVVDARDGTQLASKPSAVSNVGAGQVANWKASTTAKYAPGVTCKVSLALRSVSVKP